MDAHALTDAAPGGGAGELTSAPAALAPTYLEQLLASGLLIETGVKGLYGRSAQFEAIADGLNLAISRIGADQQAEVLRFPPALGQQDFETSEYLKSFPQLAGTIHSFCGNDRAHRQLLARVEDKQDWTDQQEFTGVVLTPAACYPIYPVIAKRGPLPQDGKVVDVLSYCYRHEPSLEPTRMQLFRQREYVCLGSPERIVAFRQLWMDRGQALGRALQLPVEVDVANDPFFGRGGKIVADSQRELKLKFELLIPVNDGAPPTACMSFNYHMDHFGALWHIGLADGGVAHTGCVGFGIERLTLALLKHHGLDPASWPQAVREALGGV
ncbi:amino acid--[acyl-carrier-protein] ligase [Cupriavidus sp. D384]|uniref:amino acid--[acyl-carrier-protein] ligase n=1 Tax=Cupriavidus sp. D384 TaxID=1538095 RepID=UPI000830CB45|nr:amino acid--[acyl-carrier-protein] ligase [Cupriavidus sp. D384]